VPKNLSGFIKEIDVEEEIHAHWELNGCFDVRFVYHLHLDEFWSVIAFAVVFDTCCCW